MSSWSQWTQKKNAYKHNQHNHITLFQKGEKNPFILATLKMKLIDQHFMNSIFLNRITGCRDRVSLETFDCHRKVDKCRNQIMKETQQTEEQY